VTGAGSGAAVPAVSRGTLPRIERLGECAEGPSFFALCRVRPKQRACWKLDPLESKLEARRLIHRVLIENRKLLPWSENAGLGPLER
jgi:hypothetical protein